MAKLDAEQQELQKKMSANQKQQAELGDAYTKAVTADAETKKEEVEKVIFPLFIAKIELTTQCPTKCLKDMINMKLNVA